MNVIKQLLDYILHIDVYLKQIISSFGGFTYVVLFIIIFCETGLVVTPFLPGDSLLFAAGALAAVDLMNVYILIVVCIVAAIIGDSVNYSIGHRIGPRAMKMNNRFLKKEYLEKAEKFYEKHGGKAIILARFVPIVRTFAPFVAGVGKMDYSKFIFYNITGGIIWVLIFVLAGYLFGNVPFVKDNFHYSVFIIIFVSLIPIIIEVLKSRSSKKSADEVVVSEEIKA